jgi:hypothetical protein
MRHGSGVRPTAYDQLISGITAMQAWTALLREITRKLHGNMQGGDRRWSRAPVVHTTSDLRWPITI